MLERRGVCGKPGKKVLVWDVPNDQKGKECEVLIMFFGETVCTKIK